jgi:hypothetical protein
MEMPFAAVRAQKPKGQEFADYFSALGKGPYENQLNLLRLTDIDPDLTGFEGGVFVNSSSRNFGVLIPHHNGRSFFGKVVIIDMDAFQSNATLCSQYVRMEMSNGTTGQYNISGPTIQDACIIVLDLSSLDAFAVGYRRGFVSYPYVYLSPGEYSIAVRIDINAIGLRTTQVLDMNIFDPSLGGYSGGFADGDWTCFSPYRTYAGNVGVGGMNPIRSKYRGDEYQLKPFYYSVLCCVNSKGWQNDSSGYVLYDFSQVYPTLKGFSEVIKIGRYAYFSPFMDSSTSYSSLLVRLHLGEHSDVGTTIQSAKLVSTLRQLTTVLDLSYLNSKLRGFSGIFNSGMYIYLVPYRNDGMSQLGNRGHGNVVRVSLNDFTLSGIQVSLSWYVF